jgi:hypothetical protein
MNYETIILNKELSNLTSKRYTKIRVKWLKYYVSNIILELYLKVFVDFIVFSILYYGDDPVNILKVKTKS